MLKDVNKELNIKYIHPPDVIFFYYTLSYPSAWTQIVVQEYDHTAHTATAGVDFEVHIGPSSIWNDTGIRSNEIFIYRQRM